MRFGLLVHPSWRDARRIEAYVLRVAEKYPDAEMLTTGVGLPIYTGERAALRSGLRVAAFRTKIHDPLPPGAPPRRRPPDDPEEVLPPYVRYFDVLVHELLPGNEEHYERLWVPTARKLATCRGEEVATATALMLVRATSNELVAFSDIDEWPGLPDVHRIGAAA